MLLENKTIAVTGAGKGIGRACISFFIKEGARVVVLTRSEVDVAMLMKAHPRDKLAVMQGDVTSLKDLQALLELGCASFGRVDGLVNNAGIRQRKDFFDLSKDEWDSVIRTNLTSCFESMQVFGRHMVEEQSGAIVNVASIIGPRGLPQLAGYATSKAGLVGLTQAVAVELANRNVRINAVCPGFASTSYAEDFKSNHPDLYEFTLERTPMHRWGTPDEVAHTIGYLLSDLSSYVTGSIYAVDGGWMSF